VYVPISQNRLGLLRDSVFLLAARAAGRRRYIHLHGAHFADFYRDADPATRALARLAVRGAHQAWVLTPGLTGMFDGLVPRSRVHVLENAVESPCNGHVPERLMQAGPLRVLFLSNLIPGKGVFDLLSAVRAMGDRAAGLELHIVGEGEAEVERRIDAAAAGLSEFGVSVERKGILTGADKERELTWADALVLPTWYPLEGQPLVLLEAMAAGLAIVTTRHAGIPDTVRDGREALLVDPGDPDAIARALTDLGDDPVLRRRIGTAARARWQERYALPRFGGDLRRLLAQSLR
jgi:glycosyltransferase involved in cell wall biosynthesis